jgi:hypothetical protein
MLTYEKTLTNNTSRIYKNIGNEVGKGWRIIYIPQLLTTEKDLNFDKLIEISLTIHFYLFK